jgi:hypothetical protein
LTRLPVSQPVQPKRYVHAIGTTNAATGDWTNNTNFPVVIIGSDVKLNLASSLYVSDTNQTVCDIISFNASATTFSFPKKFLVLQGYKFHNDFLGQDFQYIQCDSLESALAIL